VPHISLVFRENPGFLYTALSEVTSAAFSEESRIEVANTTRLDRKSGDVGYHCSFPQTLDSSDRS
jgi:hypothetical protein